MTEEQEDRLRLRGEIIELEKQLRTERERVNWLWENCKIVFYPKDGAYPIEHNPGANKDSRYAIEKLLTHKERERVKKVDALLKALDEKYPGEKPVLYDIDPDIIVAIHKRADAIMKKSRMKKSRGKQ